MAKFLEVLINKFFDFFNFGRLITIIVPGFIAAICLAMFISQLVFPLGELPGSGSALKIKSVQSKETIKTESKTKEKENTITTIKETTTTYEYGADQKTGGQETITKEKKEDKETLFIRQISADYRRVSNNFLLLLLLTIVLGLTLYEIGYIILLRFPKKSEDEKLFRYDGQNDKKGEAADKFLPSKNSVGLVYFAPFLKEKFSGEENYFNFLITEYYRFLEFSVNMPLSIIVLILFGGAYYLLFYAKNDFCPDCPGSAIFVSVLLLCSLIFLIFIVPRIARAYRKATKDLILGVTDMMNKGLINTKQG